MGDYTITQVSSKPPKEWSFKDKKTGEAIAMVTYKVLLEGVNEPEGVDLNKKSGAENKPKTGDVLHGTLEDTDFGKKFKAEKKAFGGGSNYTPRDDEAIKAQWAIGQAVSLFTSGKDEDIDDIEKNAKDFFAMIDRVKNSKLIQLNEPLPDKPGDVANNGRYDNSDFEDEPVNLDQIPF